MLKTAASKTDKIVICAQGCVADARFRAHRFIKREATCCLPVKGWGGLWMKAAPAHANENANCLDDPTEAAEAILAVEVQTEAQT